jgi:hypothetical protein
MVMGYYTNYDGELFFELNPIYSFAIYMRMFQYFGDDVRDPVLAGRLSINGSYKSYGLMEDILMFINTHGKAVGGRLTGNGEEFQDYYDFEVKDDKFIKYLYDFDDESKMISSKEELFDACDSGALREHEVKRGQDAGDKIYEILDKIYETGTFDIDALIDTLVDIKGEVHFYFDYGKYILDHNQDCYYVPFLKNETRNEIETWAFQEKKLTLSQAIPFQNINKADVIIKDGKLFDIKHHVKETLKMNQIIPVLHNESTSFCTLCVHRTQKMLNGCDTCDPEIIKMN